MLQLRWTLLCLGVLFVALLAWIEGRRQRRQGFTDHSPVADKEPGVQVPATVFREPLLTLPEMRARDPGPPQELPVVEIEDDSLRARRAPTLSLPVLESGPMEPPGRAAEPTVPRADSVKLERTDDAVSVRDLKVPRLDMPAPMPDTSDSEERAFNEAVFGDPSLEASRREPDFSDADAIAEGAVADGAPAQGMSADASTAGAPVALTRQLTAADVTPVVDPIVEWPPDDQRRVVALRLVAVPPDRLAGRALRLALASEGFVLGKFQIFHKPDENGRAVLSAANLSKPGTFDVQTMDLQRYSGLSLFAVLPGPRPALKTFDHLLATARNLNERLQGALQDERGSPLTPMRIAALRDPLATETMP